MVVLYKTTFAESASLASLTDLCARDPLLADRLDVLVMDNSPEAQAVPDGFQGRYVHDGKNAGLAARYNAGLLVATQSGLEWLLLLDQDTSLTEAYFAEVLAALARVDDDVAALVPRLMQAGQMQSPHRPFYRRVDQGLQLDVVGVAAGLVRVYNSAAVVRVRAVEAIGGFPETYGLDYLDHATFHRLQAAGGRIYLLGARVSHEMSIYVATRFADPAHAARHKGQLAAERRFYREHGSWMEKARHRLDLFKQALRPIRRRNFGDAGRMLGSAFRWE